MAQLTEFYEVGLRPAIDALLPEDVSDWPPTYRAELFRAKKSSGHLAYQTKMIPWTHLESLERTLRYNLHTGEVDWAEDFFFMYTVRGVKHTSQHSTDRDSALEKLEELCEDMGLPGDVFDRGEWWIDVGAEVCSSDQLCLQWATTSHSQIVEEALGTTSEDASRITSLGSSKYSRDIVSHLMGVSGCRIEPGVRAQGDFEAAYFQVYSTDKSITYNPEGHHHGKAIPMAMAMGSTQPAPFVTGLHGVFVDAMGKNASNARVEVRVPIVHALTVLMNIDAGVIRQSLLGFSRSVWW